jgi:hypothetical protein
MGEQDIDRDRVEMGLMTVYHACSKSTQEHIQRMWGFANDGFSEFVNITSPGFTPSQHHQPLKITLLKRIGFDTYGCFKGKGHTSRSSMSVKTSERVFGAYQPSSLPRMGPNRTCHKHVGK